MHTLSDKNELDGFVIKHKGLFDYDGLYQMMIAWFKHYLYEFHEDRYKDKTFTALGPEIEPKWKAEKKKDEYVMYTLKVVWHIWEGKDVDAQLNGSKKRLCTGRVIIDVSGEVNLNYAKIFPEKSWLHNVFKKLRMRELQQKYLQNAQDEMNKLQTEMKKFLNHPGKYDAYYDIPAMRQEVRRDL